MDAELAAKAAANYDYNAEAQAREWMESVIGEPFEGEFGPSLKNGVLLCKLLNAIAPGTIKKINESRMPFKQMENISMFLRGCRSLGVAEHSLFETVDLYEEKDLGLVVKCLFALGSTVQLTVPDFAGPHLGARIAKANKREFSAEQVAAGRMNAAITKQTAGSSKTMDRTHVGNSGPTFGAEAGGKSVDTGLTHSSLGSAKTMERSEVKRTGITAGAEYSGPSADPNAVTQASLGSFGLMERLTISNSGPTFGSEASGPSVAPNEVAQTSLGSYLHMERPEIKKPGITMGADASGAPVDNTVTQSHLGGYGIQERPEISKANNITFGAESAGIGAAGAGLEPQQSTTSTQEAA